MDLSKGFDERLEHLPERGEMRDGNIRYLMMRPDALMGLFDRLPLDARAQALEALAASVAHHGGKSVSAYRNNGASQADSLIDTIVATSAALGWGRWRFHRIHADRVEVSIDNSPFAAGATQSDLPACAPIKGILTALGPALFDSDRISVEEVLCCAIKTGASCLFVLERTP